MTMGVRPDPEADLAGALSELAGGRLDQSAFLARFGHRGPQEMELAQSRWFEEPTVSVARSLRVQDTRHAEYADYSSAPNPAIIGEVVKEANLGPAQVKVLSEHLQTLTTYLGLRETAKHYLMKGYGLIRRYLVELDRRHRLGGGIFFLLPDELPRLIAGEDLTSLIARRRRRRILALSLEVPPVLFSDDLEAIGRPVVFSGADTLPGCPFFSMPGPWSWKRGESYRMERS
jgi:pyruvate,water dikinase